MQLALKARQARMRRGVEEMQRQVRRFSRTLEKMRSPAPAGSDTSPEQPVAQADGGKAARRAS